MLGRIHWGVSVRPQELDPPSVPKNMLKHDGDGGKKGSPTMGRALARWDVQSESTQRAFPVGEPPGSARRTREPFRFLARVGYTWAA